MARFKPTSTTIVCLALAGVLVSAPCLWKRHRAETSNRAVELCLELDEARILCRAQGMELGRFLREAKNAGISSLSLLEHSPSSFGANDLVDDNLRRFERSARSQGTFPRDDVEAVRTGGLGLVLRMSNGSTEHLITLLRAFQGARPEPLIISQGEETIGYPDHFPILARSIREGPFRLALVEFSPQKGFEELAQQVPQQIVRAHSLDSNDLLKLGPQGSLTRLLRAVRERSIRLLYLHLIPEKSLADNLDWIRLISAELRRSGFTLGINQSIKAPVQSTTGRQILCFAVGLCAPLAGLWVAARPDSQSPNARFWEMSAVTLSGALLIGALGFSQTLMNGTELFRGVKAALALPLLASPFFLFSLSELKSFMKKPVSLGALIGLALTAAAAGVLLIRSGNMGGSFVSPFEGNLRELLQQIFLVRPRFKEFLIGHPLMVTGLNLSSSRSPSGARRFSPHWLLIPGMIGQVSMINTFSHFHIPIEVSLLRTFLGLAVGFSLGQLLTPILKRITPAAFH